MRTDRAAVLLLLAAFAAGAPAHAQALRAAVVHGDLVAGLPSEVHVAWADADGRPGRCSTLEVVGAAAGEAAPVAPGVESLTLVPATGPRAVVLRCGQAVVQLGVAPRASGALPAPERVDGLAGAPVTVTLEGRDLPPPEAIEVAVGEGRVTDITGDGDTRTVTIVPDDSPYPRVVQVGLRDGRGSAEPAWTAIRLRARPRLPLTAEPGTTLSLEIGERRYGPFVATAEGLLDVRVDQFPGETAVLAHFEDDLGNAVDTAIPLPTWSTPALVGMVVGERGRAGPVPRLYLRAASADGRALTEAPTCRSGGHPLTLLPVEPGVWTAALDPSPAADPRVACALTDRAATVLRVPVLDDVPARVRVRVWPDAVRTDAPRSDVFVTLEDALGRLLPPEGVQVEARTGTVTPDGVDQLVWRGTWEGLAVEGRDVVEATWSPAASGTVPAALHVDWEPPRDVDGVPTALVRVRAVDRLGRPVPEAAVVLDSGAAAVAAVTDADGWAEADLTLTDDRAPLVYTARTRWMVTRRVAQRTQPAAPLPGGLVGSAEVVVQPGRVSAIIIRVDPTVLRAGPAANAEILAWVEDPSGAIVGDIRVDVQAGEGQLGVPRQNPQGQWLVQWTPGDGDVERPVDIVAEAGGLRTRTQVTVQPRAVRLSVGPWVGAQTNLGELTRPVFGLDLDVRTRAVAESVMFRAGVHAWTWRVASAEGPDTQVDAVVVPFTAAVLLRRDRGRLGFWGGGGAVAGGERLQVSYEGTPIASGIGFVAGPVLLGGLGVRVGRSSELVLSARGTWLASGGGDVRATGNIAGVAIGAGYRLVY